MADRLFAGRSELLFIKTNIIERFIIAKLEQSIPGAQKNNLIGLFSCEICPTIHDYYYSFGSEQIMKPVMLL